MIQKHHNNKLFFKKLGAGEPVVLIHGFLENHKMWDTLYPELLKNNEVYLVDLPGHGKSNLLKDNSIEGMATAIFSILKNNTIKAVYLVGHSLGGYVALAFAKKFPEKVKGVLLMNSTPVADTNARKKLRKHGIKVAKTHYEALVRMSVTNLFNRDAVEKYKDEVSKARNEALETKREGYVVCQQAMMNRDDHTLLWKKATFKKAMLLGNQDTIIDSNWAIETFKPHNISITVVGGGHMSYIEQSKDSLKCITQFLTN